MSKKEAKEEILVLIPVLNPVFSNIWG